MDGDVQEKRYIQAMRHGLSVSGSLHAAFDMVKPRFYSSISPKGRSSMSSEALACTMDAGWMQEVA